MQCRHARCRSRGQEQHPVVIREEDGVKRVLPALDRYSHLMPHNADVEMLRAREIAARRQALPDAIAPATDLLWASCRVKSVSQLLD
jgi:hypothetical protein